MPRASAISTPSPLIPPAPSPQSSPDEPALGASGPLDAATLAQAVRESVDGVATFDRACRFTLWNPAMERIFGVPAADAIGRGVWAVLPIRPTSNDEAAFRATLAGERHSSYDREFRLPDGSRAGVIDAHYSPLQDEHGNVTGGLMIVRDVTRRARANEARETAERAADRSRRLQALTAALSEVATVEQVADVIVYKGMEAIGADAGSLALISHDAEGALQFEIVRTSGFPTEVVNRYRFFPVMPGRPLSDAVRERVPVLLASAAEWAERYADVAFETRYPAFEGFAGIPVISRGRLLAGISFSFHAAQRFDDGVRTFLDTLGEQCAQALERAGLFEAERQAREAAEAARAEAEAASRAKGEFLATMSHELRTPLNAIAGYSDLLLMGLHGPLTDEQRADLERVQRSQRHLLALVDNVLDFATLGSRRVRYETADVDVAALVADVQASISAELAAKRLRLEGAAIDPALVARADPAKLRQIVLILLSNAVKFSDGGGTVRLAAEPRGDAVAISVADTGRGVPPEEQEAIFEPFVQLDRGYTRTAEGTGLGLAIARELARGMAGDVTVASDAGHGAVFTLTVPRA